MAFTNDKTITPSLTFPCNIFATLAPSPFFEAHLQQSSTSYKSKPIRPNGRHLFEFRPLHLNAGSLSHASGSAVVRLGNTAAVAGVRPEILRVQDIPNVPTVVRDWKPDRDSTIRWFDTEKNNRAQIDDQNLASEEDEVTTLGLIVPNVEISTACAAQSGNSPGNLAQDLTQRILELLQSVGLVQADDLRLTYKPPMFDDADLKNEEVEGSDKESNEQVVAYWVLYIDITFISLDGAAFDTAWNATVAALQNLLLPRATWNAELSNIICDIDKSNSRKLRLQGVPVVVTFVAFKGAMHEFTVGQNASIGMEGKNPNDQVFVLADPDTFEESICEEVVTVVADCTGGALKILWLEKKGGSVVGRTHVRNLIGLLEDRWRELNQNFASACI